MCARAAPGAASGPSSTRAPGSFAATETAAVASYGSGRADLLLGGSFKQSHPYASGDGRNFTLAVPATLGGAPNGARFRNTSPDQTAYDLRSGWAKLGLVPAEGQRLEVAYTRQSATDVLYPHLLMDGVSDDTDRVNLTWRLAATAGPFSRAEGQAYWSRVSHGMDDRLRCSSAQDPAACGGALPRAYSMRTDARAAVLGGKLEAGLGGPEALADARVGADVYVRSWDNETTRVSRMMPGMPYSTEASIPDVTLTDVGAYGEARRALRPGLRATAGARVDSSRRGRPSIARASTRPTTPARRSTCRGPTSSSPATSSSTGMSRPAPRCSSATAAACARRTRRSGTSP